MIPNPIPVWKVAPLIRLLPPFFLGIVLQYYFSFTLTVIFITATLVSIGYLGFLFTSLSFRFRFPFVWGILFQLIMVVAGIALSYHHNITNRSNWLGSKWKPESILVVTLKEPPVKKQNSIKAEANVESLIINDSSYTVCGNIVIYFSKQQDVSAIKYGSRIITRMPISEIKRSGNPGAFDYRSYAALKNTYHTIYLKPNQFKLLEGNYGNIIMTYIYIVRDFIIAVYKKFVGPNAEIVAVAEALVIGYKDDLDKDLLKSYSNTGVVHVIAISGLHLALVNAMLDWLWKFFRIHRKKIVSGLLSMVLLWLFSILTGASASVLRSALMFSFIIIGKIIDRPGSVYNSLAASSLLLVCYDPFLLWDAGFQLSHLAVLGLITIQQPLYRSYYVKNKWLRKLWETMAVTLSAQVFTIPICLYYFHQFPNYFLLSNLIIIPLSTVILFAGIILIPLACIPFLAHWVGYFTNRLIALMNILVIEMSKLPGSLTSDLYLSLLSVLFLYFCIILFCLWVFNYGKLFLLASLLSFLLFICCRSFDSIYSKRKKCIIIYNLPHHTAVDFVVGNSCWFFGDLSLINNQHLQDSLLDNSRKSMGLKVENHQFSPDAVQHIEFLSKRLTIIDSLHTFIANKFETDVLLITGNPRINIEEIAIKSKPHLIIFDASNKLWKIDKWQKACEELNLPCYSIPHKGAWIYKLD